MSFVGSVTYATGGPYALPTGADVSSNNRSFTMFSHINVTTAGTLTFDYPTRTITVAAVPMAFAIPPAATTFTLGGGAVGTLGIDN
jgi:hypothetical protein